MSAVGVFFLVNYFIVVQLQLSAFTPHPSTPPQPNPPPSPASTPPPLGFVHVSFIAVGVFLRVGLLNQIFAFSTTRVFSLFSLPHLLLLFFLPLSLSHAFLCSLNFLHPWLLAIFNQNALMNIFIKYNVMFSLLKEIASVELFFYIKYINTQNYENIRAKTKNPFLRKHRGKISWHSFGNDLLDKKKK